MIEVLSGFVLGLFGSLHCVGMCGPLVLALPMDNAVRRSIVYQSLYYNTGRAISYAGLGLVMGSLGWCIELGGLQKLFSICIGVLMLFIGLSHYITKLNIIKFNTNTGYISKLVNQRLKRLLSSQASSSTYLKIGMLNGLIPCGLVYIALATSVTLGHPIVSGSYMFLFGLGTVPLMALVMIGANVQKSIANKLRRYLPVLTILLGLYLIWRGLMLQVVNDPTLITSGIASMSCH